MGPTFHWQNIELLKFQNGTLPMDKHIIRQQAEHIYKVLNAISICYERIYRLYSKS